jgi:DNA-directed RNA polymerase subunit F
MIKESRPICMAEVVELVGDSEKSESIKKFIKSFDILKFDKTKELMDELKALDLIKIKEDSIIKIADFVPTDAAELNKMMIDVSLDADEVNKILDVTRKFR